MFRSLGFIALTIFVCSIYGCEAQHYHNLATDNSDLEWWQTAVFYQIYPRSFKDSNADGLGDLKGIISKLDHLKEAGVTATWLSPIFDSPQIDQGYDIRNYYKIDKIFGTMEDIEELIAKAKELGIKIILDFVPNHTSDEHDWFLLSENKTKGYEDYYIWKDGTSTELPNNWISSFHGSAWTWNEERKQYYYHQFAEKQPDLNYSNPDVLQGMKDVLTFWLDKGVSGFRMDAVPYLFEDKDFRDAPLARGYTHCDDDVNCQEQVNIVKDLDETYEVIYQFRELVDKYTKDNKLSEPVILMSEAYTTIENTMLYYGSSDGTRKGAHFTFNFNFISYLKNEKFTVDDVANAINMWLVYLPKGATSNWVLGNHDNHRVATRFGEDNVDGFNMLISILPGVMVTYNGEEIGMLDGEVKCTEGADPAAIKNCSTFDQVSRDFERTPFQWDNSTYAGFSTVKTWLPVGSTKDWLNLAAQTGDTSHFSIYKQLLQFRKVFTNHSEVDNLTVMKLNDRVLQITRTRDEADYIFLFNIGKSDELIDFYRKTDCYEVAVGSGNSEKKLREQVKSELLLKSHESLILQSIKGCTNGSAPQLVFSFPMIILLCLLRFIMNYVNNLLNLV